MRYAAVLALPFILYPHVAFSADAQLLIAPSTVSTIAGETFDVAIVADTGGINVQSAEATISFNPAVLEVVSVSTLGSPLTLFATKPEFSNESGTIEFSGWAEETFSDPRPLITVTFRATASGTHVLKILSGALLSSGQATNILHALGTASVNVVLRETTGETGLVLGASALEEKPPEPPVIEAYPKDAVAGDQFFVSGKAVPNGRVRIWMESEMGRESATTPVLEDGTFMFVSDERLSQGSFELWAEAYSKSGVVSSASEKIRITVSSTYGNLLASAGFTKGASVFMPLGILLLGMLIGYGFSEFRRFRRL